MAEVEEDKDDVGRARDVGKDLSRPEDKEDGECKDVDEVSEGSSLEKPSVADRLLAISAASSDKEKVEARPRGAGKWLKEQMEEYRKKNGIESDDEATEEEIMQQIKLPSEEKVKMNEFKDPVKNWVLVEKSGVPSWIKESLLEEEREPGWEPPTPTRVDKSLRLFTCKFMEEIPKLSKISEVVKDKNEVLKEELSEDDEVVLLNNLCIIRTTKAGIKKSLRERAKEEEDDEREFRNRCGGGRSERGRGKFSGLRGRDSRRFEGGRGSRRNRSISPSIARDSRHSGHNSYDLRAEEGYSSHSRMDVRLSDRRDSHGRCDRRDDHGGSDRRDSHGGSDRRYSHGGIDRRDRYGGSDRRDRDGRSDRRDRDGGSDRRDRHGGRELDERESYDRRENERRDYYKSSDGRREREEGYVIRYGGTRRDAVKDGQHVDSDGGRDERNSPKSASTYREYKASKAGGSGR